LPAWRQRWGYRQRKVDLAEKVLYKYKDMTVEFHDGKVSDVK
jgi:ACT domain-containing protein